MTSEERMRRFTMEQFMEEEGGEHLNSPAMWKFLWQKLELAPPKDWKPFCYEELCNDTEDDAVWWGPECKDCPYRKRD
jgi:hypothetical protein